MAISRGVLEQVVLDRLGTPQLKWDKTARYRSAPARTPGAAAQPGTPPGAQP